MSTGPSTASPLSSEHHDLTGKVARLTFSFGAAYSLSLAFLERALPIKPSWVAAEVVGGVLLVGLPVMMVARAAQAAGISWRDYERMVIVGFVGAGLPIVIWQGLEYFVLPSAQ